MHRVGLFTSRFLFTCRAYVDLRALSSSELAYGPGSVALEQSYCHGASDVPLLGKTIGVALQETVEKFPEKDAFVYVAEGSRHTYRQLLDEVDCLGAGLKDTGIRMGDRVGMWGPNIKEWILTQYACARIGAILVNVNPAYRVEETAYVLKLVGVKAIVAPRTFKTQDYYSILREMCPGLETTKPGHLQSERLPDLKTVVIAGNETLKGTFKFDDVMDMGHDTRHEIENLGRDLQFDEAINIQFTSGTTGHPKGALLSHHGLLNNAYFFGLRGGYNEKGAVVSCPLPLSHSAGTVIQSLGVTVHGATGVFPSPTFEPRALLKSVQDEKCTFFIGVPTVYIDTLSHADFDKYDTSSLRSCAIGASPCPEEVLKLAKSKLNLTPLVAYGMTESGPVASCTLHRDTPEVTLTTVGKPFDHMELKVVNTDTKTILPVNELGEVCMRGYPNMKCYWNNPEKTNKSVIDGWMHSGDLGKMDEKGNISIVGRIKDVIIRGGVNIFPVEIEDFLYQHPKVETVQIVSVPDERMGEEICACIRLKHGETSTSDEIKAFCQGKISHFKIPRYVEFVETFPITVTLKVKKADLRDIMAKKLGLAYK